MKGPTENHQAGFASIQLQCACMHLQTGPQLPLPQPLMCHFKVIIVIQLFHYPDAAFYRQQYLVQLVISAVCCLIGDF